MIKEYFPDKSNTNFEFAEVSQYEVKKEVLHLNVKNSSTSVLYSSSNSETI